jgi:hypothetical protein
MERAGHHSRRPLRLRMSHRRVQEEVEVEGEVEEAVEEVVVVGTNRAMRVARPGQGIMPPRVDNTPHRICDFITNPPRSSYPYPYPHRIGGESAPRAVHPTHLAPSSPG